MTENTKQNNEDSDLDSHLKRLEEMLVEFERLRNEVVRLQSAEGFSSLFGTDGVIERIDEIIKNGPDIEERVLDRSSVTEKAELVSKIVGEFKSAIELRPVNSEVVNEEDLSYEKLAEYDEKISGTISKAFDLLRQISTFFSLQTTDREWGEELAEIKEAMSDDEIGFQAMLEGGNEFLKSTSINVSMKVENIRFEGLSEFLPSPKVFLDSILYLTTVNLTGYVQAFISYLASINGLEFKELFKREPKMKTLLDGGGTLVKQNNIVAAVPFEVEQEDESELNDLLARALYTVDNYSTFLKNIRIGSGTYKPELSNPNSHMITNKNAPSLTYQNLGMWPSRCDDYNDLIIVDTKNWLGSEYQGENIPGVKNMHKIYYRDFLDFIQQSGFEHKKVTGYKRHQRIEASLNSFSWAGKMRKFRSNASIFFYNPNCEISNSPIRIVVDSVSTSFEKSMRVSVGIDFFKHQLDEEFDNDDERNIKLRQLAENYCVKLLDKFEQFQMKNGLLKNAKFDAYINELALKGRTFDDMLISETKKKLLDDNIFAILRNSEILQDRGVETNRGVMLAGPPGVGKSLTIDAIVSHGKCTVLYANFMMLHQKMDFIFQTARKYAPTILILEDIDALGITGQRGETSGGMGLSNLLNNMDGISNNNGVITVATTNHPESMDWALIARPGRFDVRIDYPYPDHDLLKGIMNLKLSKYPCENDLQLDSIISKMPLGFTGSHIQDIVNQANYISINDANKKSTDVKITKKSLHTAFERSLYNFNKFLAERPHIKLANPESASKIISDNKSKNDDVSSLFS